MLTPNENDILTRVGPGTPMGNLMRRYWVPALLSWELGEPDCPPVELRLLGEDLVAFRDTTGAVGIVSAFCAHRRVSLFWGRNEESGLRCVYHGWKFDVTGACVDMPSEPSESNFKDKVHIPAYPTYEVGGVIWAYMGPEGKQPAPPLFEWTQVPETHRGLSKVREECNWMQALEGGIDTVHSNFLHFGRPPGKRYDDSTARGRALNTSTAPLLEVVPTGYGYSYAGIRTMGDGNNYIRAYHWVMPWNQIRASGKHVSGHMWVPIDDYNTTVFNWTYTYHEEPLPDAEKRMSGGNQFGVNVDVERDFASIRNKANRYLIDRQRQKTDTYTGIEGINTQDRAVQESMGYIVDRSLERLGTTDRAIIVARRELLKAIESVQAGSDPKGLSADLYKLRAIEKVLPESEHWFEALSPELFQLEQPIKA